MTKKSYPTDVISQAQVVADAWGQIDPQLTLGELTQAGLRESIGASAPIENEIMSLETRLTELRNQRDDLYASIWDQVKRTRSGVKAIYGDDSSQYEMVGGTRFSERKPYSRREIVSES